MARKFTTLKFMNDENEIKNMIKIYKPEIRFIKISYVRDDRIVDLKTNQVHIGTHPESTYANTHNIWRTGGDVSVDKLENAVLHDHLIIGKKVYIDMNADNTIHLNIEDHIVANLDRGSFDFPNIEDVNLFIEQIEAISGCEWIAKEMRLVQPYYSNHGVFFLAKMWHIVNKYNLFDLLEQYSNLFTYYSDLYLDSTKSDFFEAASLPQEFLFRLTNYYLKEKDGRDSVVRELRKENYLWKFYEALPDECKTVFLQEAEKERYDIAIVCSPLSYRSQDILTYATRSPIFFMDYMKHAKTHADQEGILSAFLRDAKSLDSYQLPLDFSSMSHLKYEKKAKEMRLSTSEFFNLVSNLDTKEGLLNYLQNASTEY